MAVLKSIALHYHQSRHLSNNIKHGRDSVHSIARIHLSLCTLENERVHSNMLENMCDSMYQNQAHIKEETATDNRLHVGQ